MTQLRDSHSALLASKNQLEASHRLEINRSKEVEIRSKQEAASSREKATDLENELLARKEVTEAANEATVIKVRRFESNFRSEPLENFNLVLRRDDGTLMIMMRRIQVVL